MDSETNIFPTLFVIAKTGKKQYWKIEVNENIVIREYGKTDGKPVTVSRKYESKNIGKKNETSANEQARFEAQKLWASQLKKNYKPDDNDTTGQEIYNSVMETIDSQGGNLHNIRGTNNQVSVAREQGTRKRTEINMPMKAEKFDDFWGKHMGGKETKPLHFNPEKCFIQPKLDGIRGLAYLDDEGEIHLTSRTGKEFVFLTAIRLELGNKFDASPQHKKYKLDGEFYVHNIYDKNKSPYSAPERFRIITGACRSKRNAPSEHEYLIEYHVFDLVNTENPDMIFEERHKLLREFFDNTTSTENTSSDKVKMVETIQLDTPTSKDLWTMHDTYVEDKYEGAMIRDKSGIYSDKRVPQLLKLKAEMDDEFKIIGGKSGEGTEQDCIVYELETKQGYKFMCRPKGAFSDRRRALRELGKNIGKMYTVHYRELDTETGIPIHACGKAIRYD